MRNLLHVTCLLLVVVTCQGEETGADEMLQEPKCFSRFDYDYKMIEKLIKLEERQEKLQTSLENQQKYIKDLEEKLRVELLPHWGDWSSWSDCYMNCSGNNGGRVQSRSRQTVTNSLNENLQKETENELRPCNAVQFAGCIKDYGENDSYGVTYDFADQIAVSTCTALLTGSGNYVYAVRRKCSNLAVSCAETCTHVGLSCFNALHVHRGSPVVRRNQDGAKGLYLYRYNSCGGNFCGPNFCCCHD